MQQPFVNKISSQTSCVSVQGLWQQKSEQREMSGVEVEWETQVRLMRPSHASTLGHILDNNQEWKRLMGHIPNDFFTLDKHEKERKKFDATHIE